MAYSALDVARYVINYSNKKEYDISNLRLQKLLYFIQAYFLIHPEKECACFSDKIEAWDFGPVIPDVYREFKRFGSADIPPITHYYVFDENIICNTKRLSYSDDIIAERDKVLINRVVDIFSSYSTSELVSMTHNQDPWLNAFVAGENNEITVTSIKNYFTES